MHRESWQARAIFKISPNHSESRESVYTEVSGQGHAGGIYAASFMLGVLCKCNDILQLINAGEDVLVFYNDKASFNHFIEIMRSQRHSMDEGSPLRYHVELVKLLACCTMGKNVYTEIKCHSLLPLDDIVTMITHPDCIPEVKEAYVGFLNHCYIDTEVEMKEIYTSNHMWCLFEKSFLVDMADIATAPADRKHPDKALENYVTNGVMNIISTFFSSPFSDQSTTLQVALFICIRVFRDVCAW